MTDPKNDFPGTFIPVMPGQRYTVTAQTTGEVSVVFYDEDGHRLPGEVTLGLSAVVPPPTARRMGFAGATNSTLYHPVVKLAETPERLVAVALIRDGETHHGHREHWALRAALGDTDPHQKKRTDEYGFWTSDERFVDRAEAMEVGSAAGQCSMMGRELLSCDVNWEPKQGHTAVRETREERRRREKRQRKAFKL